MLMSCELRIVPNPDSQQFQLLFDMPFVSVCQSVFCLLCVFAAAVPHGPSLRQAAFVQTPTDNLPTPPSHLPTTKPLATFYWLVPALASPMRTALHPLVTRPCCVAQSCMSKHTADPVQPTLCSRSSAADLCSRPRADKGYNSSVAVVPLAPLKMNVLLSGKYWCVAALMASCEAMPPITW